MAAKAPPAHALVIGASAGGIAVLRTILGGLRPDLALAVMIVLHVGDESIGDIALLFPGSRLPIREAQDAMPIEPGQVYLAPAGYHLLVEQNHHLALSVDERVCYCRPSIDVLFESAAEAYRRALVGVVLSGANADGAAGLARVVALGGKAMVQDPATAEFPIMPQEALLAAPNSLVRAPLGLVSAINSL